MLYEVITYYAYSTSILANTADILEKADDRITSYNVCYTKLLRIASWGVADTITISANSPSF